MKKSELIHCFDAVGPTEQQQAALWSQIANSGAQHSAPMRGRRRLVIVAIAVCLLLTTAMAAHHFGLDEKLRSFLQVEDSTQAESLANGAYQVNKRVSNRDGTLVFNQILGDSNHIYLTMDFKAPEGTVLDAARYRFASSFPKITNYAGSYSYGFTKMEDVDPTDNHIALVMTITTESAVVGETLSLEFNDIEAAAPFPSLFEPMLFGRWKVSFPLNYQDCSVTQTLNTPFSFQGYNLTLQDFAISPLSVTFHAGGSHARDALYAAEAATDRKYVFPVTIQLLDGSSLVLDETNSGMTYDITQRDIFLTFTFDKVIDMKTVRSVSFCGTELSLE